MTATSGRITKVRFAGLRTAASVELDLDGLTVLVGHNGVGKSTVIEGVELLRQLMAGEDFVRSLHDEHGGASVITHGADELTLGCDMVTSAGPASYGLIVGRVGGGVGISHESLTVGDTGFIRQGNGFAFRETPDGRRRSAKPGQPLVYSLSPDEAFAPIGALLDAIEVHGPFATTAKWLDRSTAGERTARGDNVIQATTRVARGGTNLANAYHALRSRDDWEDTLEIVRLLVDDDVKDIITPASASGGSIGLAVRYRTGTVPAYALSDGTLALLALVAVTKLDGGSPPRSLLVLDEPDLHLHPSALRHVVELLERCAEKYPVVVATHSDHLLDYLTSPARSTVLCDLDEHRHLRLQRPDPPTLASWLRDYRGIGHLRAEGYGSLVFPPPSRAAEK